MSTAIRAELEGTAVADTDPPPTITHRTTHRMFKIYINGVLHLSLKTADICGVQAWKEHNMYRVEYNVGSVTVLSEYSDRRIWEGILRVVDQELLEW